MSSLAEGIEGFVEGLRLCGAQPHVEGAHVMYLVEPVEGSCAGGVVETAVAANELERWPIVPPHWVHLPASVRFPSTNSQASALSGWVQHSRQIASWGRDAVPAQGWLAHVRSVVGEAQ